ncbi:4Fe-4S dicluster domain-containing protein [Streptomyces sp. MST-110588]|uniref:4Fe-4S dicluster domain-containing protein n=1 Tax=Streptomyces sp. MST-110588 TaxID=2833628 RepID=UPI001F5D7370|nr:4Fe-4S dicluster domain-containing protein [Streptomyces sp. MST-110588]UNO43362.1 4Fe-4S dicluster domain-containing protein [Streptomyces sp. MST-110588]
MSRSRQVAHSTQGAVISASDGLAALVAVLAEDHAVIGPTVRDGAIVLARISCADQLPHHCGVELAAGRYRLVRRTDGMVFAHSAGPQSWKAYLHPQRERLWTVDRDPQGNLAFREEDGEDGEPPAYAFLGVRPCDLRAIAIQDRVLGGGPHAGTAYRRRRDRTFVVAVECTDPGATCFCTSMGTGPGVGERADGAPGYDLALTEVRDEDGHRFLVRCGGPAGERVLARLPHRTEDASTRAAARAAVTAAAQHMDKAMPPVDLHALMAGSLDAARWDDVAARCLTCGNCTMVCPTCFCTTTEDTTDLTGDHAERWQRWDSCFDLDFSHLHGGPVRASARSRYRQWLTHKLGTWHDQFGESGCVGCGRCIVWCPAGIDITEEAAALHAEATGSPATEEEAPS